MQLNALKQGNKSVQEYIQEWERLTVLCDVDVTKEISVGKFIAGLEQEIRRKLIFTPDLTIHSAGHLALEVEENILRKKSHPSNAYTKTTKTYNPRTSTTPSMPRKEAPISTLKNPHTRTNAPARDPKDVVCFKYNGRGHYRADCPNARVVTIQEWEQIKQDNRPKVILVSRNGKEEEVWPSTHQDDPDGTYIVGKDGTLQPYDKEDTESEEKDSE